MIMGQKYAAYDSTGVITGFYDSEDSPVPNGITAIEITNEQWLTCLGTPGYTVVDGLLSAPVAKTDAELLQDAISEKLASLASECQSKLTAGFQSNALGSTTDYPSLQTDQINLQSAALAAAASTSSEWQIPLWCQQNGVWNYVNHTATQVQQVNIDWVSYRSSVQSAYATAIAQANSVTTLDALQSVTM